jgi:hypothetical protein
MEPSLFVDPSKPQVEQLLLERYPSFSCIFSPYPSKHHVYFGFRRVWEADQHRFDLHAAVVKVQTGVIPELELNQFSDPLFSP